MIYISLRFLVTTEQLDFYSWSGIIRNPNFDQLKLMFRSTWNSEEGVVRLRIVVHLVVEIFRYDGETSGCRNFCSIRVKMIKKKTKFISNSLPFYNFYFFLVLWLFDTWCNSLNINDGTESVFRADTRAKIDQFELLSKPIRGSSSRLNAFSLIVSIVSVNVQDNLVDQAITDNLSELLNIHRHLATSTSNKDLPPRQIQLDFILTKVKLKCLDSDDEIIWYLGEISEFFNIFFEVSFDIN